MECKKCGQCCRIEVGKDFWKQAIKKPIEMPGIPAKVLITDEQVQMLLKARKYEGRGCEMLADNLCLIHELLGYEYKPKKCKDYPPKNESCICEK